MRPRFCLRTLLILTALLAAACYWWVARPTVVAQQFIVAIDRDDFHALQSNWVDADDKTYFARYASARQAGLQPRAKCAFFPRTWADLRRGERRLQLMTPSPYAPPDSPEFATTQLTVSNAGVRGPDFVFTCIIPATR